MRTFRHHPFALLAALVLSTGCAAASREPAHAGAATTATASPMRGAFDIPAAPSRALLPRTLVARGLNNPRGMHALPNGALLVNEAGTGDPEAPRTGTVLRLTDEDGDGDFLDDGERTELLGEQPSKNILSIVRRDEVFGMAGMAAGGGQVLTALAFFGGPSTVLSIEGDEVASWGTTHLNLNDLAYDPGREEWLAVASTTDEVVRLKRGEGAERILKIPPLPSGQDAVPGYLRHDPRTGDVLVSLFSGSPEGEEGGEGTELVPRAGAIIRVDTERSTFEWEVTGLTVPTDFEIGPDGSIYVLEFCASFLDPVPTRQAMFAGSGHGGFERYSGRLLRVDRASDEVTVVAEGLDAPTNLALAPGALYVAEGMGTPGRKIPGPSGEQPLEGFIERIERP
jgi:hypothetical protein